MPGCEVQRSLVQHAKEREKARQAVAAGLVTFTEIWSATRQMSCSAANQRRWITAAVPANPSSMLHLLGRVQRAVAKSCLPRTFLANPVAYTEGRKMSAL